MRFEPATLLRPRKGGWTPLNLTLDRLPQASKTKRWLTDRLRRATDGGGPNVPGTVFAALPDHVTDACISAISYGKPDGLDRIARTTDAMGLRRMAAAAKLAHRTNAVPDHLKLVYLAAEAHRRATLGL